jgi:uncharacterized lipoprotein YmbA
MKHAALLLALLLAAASSACGMLDPRPDHTRLCVLATIDELASGTPGAGASEAGASNGLVLGLGPIVLPEYLLRSELMTRTGPTRVVPSGIEHWAEPLDRALARALALDLAGLTGATRVIEHPWYAPDAPRWQIRVSFDRFERESGPRAVLAARWEIVDGQSGKSAVQRATRLEPVVDGEDGAAAALALSRALLDLSREIASALREVEAVRAPGG